MSKEDQRCPPPPWCTPTTGRRGRRHGCRHDGARSTPHVPHTHLAQLHGEGPRHRRLLARVARRVQPEPRLDEEDALLALRLCELQQEGALVHVVDIHAPLPHKAGAKVAHLGEQVHQSQARLHPRRGGARTGVARRSNPPKRGWRVRRRIDQSGPAGPGPASPAPASPAPCGCATLWFTIEWVFAGCVDAVNFGDVQEITPA